MSIHRISSDTVSLNITFSLGGASTENHSKDVTAEEFIMAADEALREAKNKGRNCVVIYRK
jgi:PleD family two-component response regulator